MAPTIACSDLAPEAEAMGRDLAHLDLADLAGDGHGELVDDLEVARHLVVGDLAPAEGLEAGERELVALPQPHPGADLLAVLGIGHADDLHVSDGWVGVEELLDLARVDVLAAPDDHVLDAPRDGEVALVVEDAEV